MPTTYDAHDGLNLVEWQSFHLLRVRPLLLDVFGQHRPEADFELLLAKAGLIDNATLSAHFAELGCG